MKKKFVKNNFGSSQENMVLFSAHKNNNNATSNIKEVSSFVDNNTPVNIKKIGGLTNHGGGGGGGDQIHFNPSSRDE